MKKLITTSLVAAAALLLVDTHANDANAGFRISFGNGHGGFYVSNNHCAPRSRWEKVRVKVYDNCGHFVGWRWKWVRVYY